MYLTPNLGCNPHHFHDNRNWGDEDNTTSIRINFEPGVHTLDEAKKLGATLHNIAKTYNMEIVPSDICAEQIPLCATHDGINETDTCDLREELEQALTNHGYAPYDDYDTETD